MKTTIGIIAFGFTLVFAISFNPQQDDPHNKQNPNTTKNSKDSTFIKNYPKASCYKQEVF